MALGFVETAAATNGCSREQPIKNDKQNRVIMSFVDLSFLRVEQASKHSMAGRVRTHYFSRALWLSLSSPPHADTYTNGEHFAPTAVVVVLTRRGGKKRLRMYKDRRVRAKECYYVQYVDTRTTNEISIAACLLRRTFCGLTSLCTWCS